MFSISTQYKFWLFPNENHLFTLRQKANFNFIEQYGKNIKDETKYNFFLSPQEERMLCKYYEHILRDFCRKFQPEMPKCVLGTSFQYFKRFYLNNSVMDYHPKNVMVTCVYLACKVEEFNVSITQFVANIKGDREKAMDVILNNELLLMQQLNYHLTIHNPYHPIEGFLIDIKTRYHSLNDPERLRPFIDEFLDRSVFSDVYLLYPPSQVALAAILYSATKLKENVDSYITDILMTKSTTEKIINLKNSLRSICSMIKISECPPKEQVKVIEKKLEKCRNQENNPDSAIYKRKLQEMLEEEEWTTNRKYARISEEQKRIEEELLGTSRSSDLC